ncbi:MAG TPA: hypothetical protein VMT15_14915 [Bryobacteraceae bacterium]|nr:hypothetical protein [Bryobacteraceae bacterium]
MRYLLQVEFVVLCLAATHIKAQDIAPAVKAIATNGKVELPPLDGDERMKDYLKSLIRPNAIFYNVLVAGMAQATNFPHEWGRTGDALGKRVGSQFAQYFLDNTIELGVSTLLKEDNRYVRLGEGGFLHRFGNVAKSTVVVSSTTGGHTLALGQIAGAFGSWTIASQYWEPPSQQRVSRIMLWGSVNVIAKGGKNLMKEFGPDLRKKHLLPSHP